MSTKKISLFIFFNLLIIVSYFGLNKWLDRKIQKESIRAQEISESAAESYPLEEIKDFFHKLEPSATMNEKLRLWSDDYSKHLREKAGWSEILNQLQGIEGFGQGRLGAESLLGEINESTSVMEAKLRAFNQSDLNLLLDKFLDFKSTLRAQANRGDLSSLEVDVIKGQLAFFVKEILTSPLETKQKEALLLNASNIELNLAEFRDRLSSMSNEKNLSQQLVTFGESIEARYFFDISYLEKEKIALSIISFSLLVLFNSLLIFTTRQNNKNKSHGDLTYSSDLISRLLERLNNEHPVPKWNAKNLVENKSCVFMTDEMEEVLYNMLKSLCSCGEQHFCVRPINEQEDNIYQFAFSFHKKIEEKKLKAHLKVFERMYENLSSKLKTYGGHVFYKIKYDESGLKETTLTLALPSFES